MKKLTVLRDSAMREQIGAVCVYWSLLELMVERVIADLERKPGRVSYKTALTRRLEKLKTLAGEHLPGHAAEIDEIADQISELSKDRHRVVHGLWAIDETNAIVWAIRLGAKLPEPREKQMQLEQIRQIKFRIWETYKRLEPFGGRGKSAVEPRASASSIAGTVSMDRAPAAARQQARRGRDG
jgi:hypothetical protein